MSMATVVSRTSSEPVRARSKETTNDPSSFSIQERPDQSLAGAARRFLPVARHAMTLLRSVTRNALSGETAGGAAVQGERRADGGALGCITELSGSRITVTRESGNADEREIEMGALVKVCAQNDVIGIVSSLHLSDARPALRSLSVDLLGELDHTRDGGSFFRQGVSRPPALGAVVWAATDPDRAIIYGRPAASSIRLGTLSNNELQPAFATLDDLLAKHFAIVGSTGCGKSCTVALILAELIADHPYAHVVLFDPHNEYSAAFSNCQRFDMSNTHLPIWLLDFEEALHLLVRGGTPLEQQAQAMILQGAIKTARQVYANRDEAPSWLTVDSPTPFLISELRRQIRHAVGASSSPDAARPVVQLLARLDSLVEDPRYDFMFNQSGVVEDTLVTLISAVDNIPSSGKQISIIDLSGLPSEVVNVVVSLFARVTFEWMSRCPPERRAPILIACEEAHRYLPSDEAFGTFAACTRNIGRIAREGRKYGMSLALISQRPSELSSKALSQCGTIFALRLANDLDKRIIQDALPDSGRTMLDALSSLPNQQAIVFGQAVPLPMRISFDTLPPERRPRSSSARFSDVWDSEPSRTEMVEDAVRSWREGP